MMKLALLGCSEETLSILPSLLQRGFSVTHVAMPEVPVGRIESITGRPVVVVDDLAEWLDGPAGSDAVVVSTPPTDETVPLLRRWAAESFPTLAIVPVCDALSAHELAMQNPGHPVPHVVWFPEDDPAWQARIARWIASPEDSPIGPIQRLEWHVGLPPDPSCIARNLARHAYWSRRCGLVFQAMGAFAPLDAESPALDRMEVTITTDVSVVVSWHNAPRESHEIRLRIEGERDHVELVYRAEEGRWKLRHGPEEATAEIEPHASALDVAAERLVEEIGSPERRSGGDESWTGLCQALEVADRFEYSLRRRRMVDLVQQTPSEETAFKGVMAAGSCLMLSIVLAIFVFGSIWESAVRARPRHSEQPGATSRPGVAGEGGSAQHTGVPAIRWRRLWPAIPLVVYLLMQLLIVIARASDRQRKEAEGDGSSLGPVAFRDK